jgi:hypothetical protein
MFKPFAFLSVKFHMLTMLNNPAYLYYAQQLHLLHGLLQRSIGLQHASHQPLSKCQWTEMNLHFP